MAVQLIETRRKLPSGKSASYYMLRWPGTDGKRQTESLGKAKKSGGRVGRADAEELRRQKEIDLGTGNAGINRARRMTLREFFKAHRDIAEGKVSGRTLCEYDYAAGHAMAALGENIVARTITEQHVGRIEKHLRDKGRSPATINKTLRALRAIFNRGKATLRAIERNPFVGWELPASGARDARVFSAAEVERIIEAAPSDWWALFVRLAADSGLRKMEMLHLRWSDIDLAEATVKVQGRKASEAADGLRMPAWTAKTKQGNNRTIPIPETTAAALGRARMAGGDASPYVFISADRLRQIQHRISDAGNLPPNFDLVPNMLRDFKAMQSRAGIARVGCLHDLRVSYGTRLASALPLHVLREYMGHANIETTAKFYLKTSADDASKARRALAGVA